ncbi:MAG: DNA polymerase IV [Microgenomates group bacterium]
MIQNLTFNPASPTVMHLDLNSCFASIEQQVNPLLRGKPIAVAAYVSPGGCILAASIEAKTYGVKTGLRVKEGKLLCPHLIILPSDPDKYRQVHLKFRQLLSDYTDEVVPKSIDEFVLDLSDFVNSGISLEAVAKQIKQRIKNEIGDWLTISVGLGPNRFLAKTAAGLHKPDGLDVIDQSNYQSVYQKLTLVDLHGINVRNAARLNRVGVRSVEQFAVAPVQTLHSAFGSAAGHYWYLRLRGWEIDAIEFGRKSFSNSYALPKPLITETELTPILAKLVEKTAYRLRRGGYTTSGVHLAIVYRDGTYWHQGLTIPEIFASNDVYRYVRQLLQNCRGAKPVRNLAVSCFNLKKQGDTQLVLFENILKKKKLARAVDKIKRRYGQYVIASALMLPAKDNVPDRIAFE